MKKTTLAALVTIFIFSLVFAAVKHHPVAATAPKKVCCKSTCPKQKAIEEKKSNSGLIFWDTYSGQLLNIQAISPFLH
ncbi:MAG: hypothetical protein ACM3H8_09945 [Sphingobacteriales bacterium]